MDNLIDNLTKVDEKLIAIDSRLASGNIENNFANLISSMSTFTDRIGKVVDDIRNATGEIAKNLENQVRISAKMADIAEQNSIAYRNALIIVETERPGGNTNNQVRQEMERS